VATASGPVELAELTAVLSLAADMAAGLSLEHGLRSCLLATCLATRAGLGHDEVRDVYYTALLRSIGCTSDSHEQAELFGDEIAARAELNLAPHLPPRELLGALTRHSGAGLAPARRARAIGRTLAAARMLPRQITTAHCEVAQQLAARLSLPRGVPASLYSVSERWDGKGFPAGLRAGQIPVAARFAQVSYDALLLAEHMGGTEQIGKLAGTWYDPDVAPLLAPGDAADVLELAAPWDEVLTSEPGGPITLTNDQFDRACEAAADFADLKSPWLLGHSRGVAELAEAAAWRAGLEGTEVAAVRRAGLLHDLGRAAIPSGAWDRRGPLRDNEWEQVRLHPYYTERFLARSPRLAPLGVIAAAHHERLDGSGYHRACGAAQLPAAARLLAAADGYQAMTRPRPHRDLWEADQAAAELESQARRGTLDGAAVQAVLAAAGQRQRASRQVLPAGLSEREAQVLALLARGISNRAIAGQLGITPKTAGHHVEHIYAKIGVSTRAAAALFALQHGLLEP
jgi:HD-GYP domain-containing protein (c-di-GMP phosphodiesterase class II)